MTGRHGLRIGARAARRRGAGMAAPWRAAGLALALTLVAGQAMAFDTPEAGSESMLLAPMPAQSVGTLLPAQRDRNGRQPPAPAPAQPGAQPAHMPFYVATRGPLTIYLLGTLHICDPADYHPGQPFRRSILDAIAASPVLALELSPDDLVASQQKVSQNGVCRRACLPRLVPAPLWARLQRRLRGNPAALAAVRNMQPWLAALVVESYDAQAAGLQSEYGTEDQLQNVYLKRRGGRIVGLESLDEQMRAFTGLTPAQSNEMLAQDLEQRAAQNAADIRRSTWRCRRASRRSSTNASCTHVTSTSRPAWWPSPSRAGRCSWRSVRSIWAAGAGCSSCCMGKGSGSRRADREATVSVLPQFLRTNPGFDR
jgi:uncharacterized protein